MLGERQRAFLLRHRIGRLATADAAGVPHLVPACFALGDEALYTAVDEKPKRERALKRLRNIAENPAVCFLVDHYDEDWSRLGWVMIGGKAEILGDGPESDRAVEMLRARYVQYQSMQLEPVIAIRMLAVTSWGNLDQ
ncbi:MAG TPA: TIGR03668 family PPOX class F420-dependent oxidoreductase [Rhizomicrobium sp.]|jgi:PPOX class probable F420-dependent enzyme|nr:TIGR03668 family PPOX class F420-dependent oxidoreductase [Rhizomicrobium sp.]